MSRCFHLRFTGALLTALSVLAGCSGSAYLDSANAGRTTSYEIGLPNFDMEAIATWQGGQPGLNLYLSIPHSSLVFMRSGEAYEASFESIIRLLDRRGRALVAEQLFEDSVRVPHYEATQDFAPITLEKHIPLQPGRYVAEVVLVDRRSEKQAVRRQAVDLVQPEQEAPFLSRIHLEGQRRGEPFAPAVSLHLPGGMDSLRASVVFYDGRAGDEVEVLMRLLRLPSDTAVAVPPYWLVPSRGSLYYQGVLYHRADTLQVTRRSLAEVDEEVEVAFALPPLDEGVYRVEVEARVEPHTEGRPLLRQVRDFTVTSPSFPGVTTLDQLVESLAYIAYEREVKFIQEAATPEEKKRRFDAFWGSLVTNRERAANLLKLYYGRIEESNLLFTTFKEGWKTDRGMVYVILGAPLYVESRIDTEVWYYSYSDYDPLSTFVFERVRILPSDQAFENYVLQRRPTYDQAWLRALDRWRSGVVL